MTEREILSDQLRTIWLINDDPWRSIADFVLKRARKELEQTRAALAPLDAVVHYLGIEDSETDPVAAIQERERAAAEKARAEGFAAGIERAAEWHDDEAERIRHDPRWNKDYGPAIGDHEEAAHSIRALAQPPAQ